MAKPIILQSGESLSTFSFKKLDRSRLYGRRQRHVLGPDGKRCERAALSEDGSIIIRKGMTDQGYVDEAGVWYSASDLVGLAEDGQPVEKVTSTLGRPVDIGEPVDPHEVLALGTRTVYVLTAEEIDADLDAALDRGEIFKIPFNYRSDYNAETAFILRNDDGTFALVGDPRPDNWSDINRIESELADDADDEDLDFEMF